MHSSNPAQKSERTRHSEANRAGQGSLFQALRDEWQAFRRDQPGQRFVGHYRRMRESGSMKLRIIGIVLGAILVAGGAVLLFMPGPGLLLIVFGLALLAGESKRLAGWLDRAEPPVRRQLGYLRRRWKRLRARLRRGPA